MANSVMLIGLGDLGGWVLEFLARQEGIATIITVDIREDYGRRKTLVAELSSAHMGYNKQFFFHNMDVSDIDATAELIKKYDPTVIYTSVSLQSYWVSFLLPPEVHEKLEGHSGIGYVPDDRRIFPDLTTEENLEITGRLARKNGKRWTIEKVYELFPVLKDLRSSKGMCLSGGEQKMLAIGRALMKNPELLLLDEPAEGLGPLIVRDLIKVIREIKEAGVTILLADQNLKFCRRIGDRGYIIDRGLIHYQGKEVWTKSGKMRK